MRRSRFWCFGWWLAMLLCGDLASVLELYIEADIFREADGRRGALRPFALKRSRWKPTHPA